MNQELFIYINSLAGKNHLFDLIGMGLAKGTPYLFIIVEVYLYFIMKKKNEAIFAFYSVTIALLLNITISLFYFHNRPFMDNLGIQLIKHLPDNSFPSDHTTFLFAIAFSLMFSKINYLFKTMLFIFAFTGSISRIYVGVHYPYDILGGITSGLFGATLVYLIQDKLILINKLIFKIENKIFRRNNNDRNS